MISSSVMSGANDLNAFLHCQYAGVLAAAMEERNAVAAHTASSSQFIAPTFLTMNPSIE